MATAQPLPPLVPSSAAAPSKASPLAFLSSASPISFSWPVLSTLFIILFNFSLGKAVIASNSPAWPLLLLLAIPFHALWLLGWLFVLLIQEGPGWVDPQTSLQAFLPYFPGLELSDLGSLANRSLRQLYTDRSLLQSAPGIPSKYVARWCEACQALQPPRSKHCYSKECGRCVERMDHHCAMLGCCIGRKNYALFLGFLLAAAGSAVVWLLTYLLAITVATRPLGWQLSLAAVLAFSVLCLLSFFLISHARVIKAGLTTNEAKNYRRYHYLQADRREGPAGAGGGSFKNPFKLQGDAWEGLLRELQAELSERWKQLQRTAVKGSAVAQGSSGGVSLMGSPSSVGGLSSSIGGAVSSRLLLLLLQALLPLERALRGYSARRPHQQQQQSPQGQQSHQQLQQVLL